MDYSPDDSESEAESEDDIVQYSERYRKPETFCVISPYLLQDLIDEQTVCRHCAKKIVLVENISLSQSLGRAWALHCTNKECLSQKSSDHFTTPK